MTAASSSNDVTARSSSSPRRSLKRITPVRSSTKIDGNKRTPHRVVMGPVMPPSHQHRQVISPLAIDSRSVSRLASVFTLSRVKGLPTCRGGQLALLGVHAGAGAAPVAGEREHDDLASIFSQREQLPLVIPPHNLRRELADAQMPHREQLALGDRAQRPLVVPVRNVGELGNDSLEQRLRLPVQGVRVSFLHEPRRGCLMPLMNVFVDRRRLFANPADHLGLVHQVARQGVARPGSIAAVGVLFQYRANEGLGHWRVDEVEDPAADLAHARIPDMAVQQNLHRPVGMISWPRPGRPDHELEGLDIRGSVGFAWANPRASSVFLSVSAA